MRQNFLSIFTTLFFSAVLSTSATAQSWDLPTGYAPTNFHTLNIERFASAVGKATDGKLVIKVHPGASLYKMPEIKRAVQTGQVPIGETLMVTLSNENPLFAIDGMPFFASSYALAEKLWRIQRPYIDKLLTEQGLKLLFAVPWPPQGLMVNKEVNSISDLAGLSFRAYDRQTSRLAELFKARPITIQAAEVAQAMSTGKINSLIASAQSAVDYKAWESIKYFYDIQAWLPKNMVIVNQAEFSALNPSTQKALIKAGQDAETAGWQSSKEVSERTKKILQENGMIVLTPSQELVNGLNELGKVMLAEWLAKAGTQSTTVVESFRK